LVTSCHRYNTDYGGLAWDQDRITEARKHYLASQQAHLKASNTGAGDHFGNSVALAGDTLVVGALYEDSFAVGVNGNQADNLAPDAGAAYVLTGFGPLGSRMYLPLVVK
jgi:hypothetical protein